MDNNAIFRKILEESSLFKGVEFLEQRASEHLRDLEYCNKKIDEFNSLSSDAQRILKECERQKELRQKSEAKRKELQTLNSERGAVKFKGIVDSNKNLREKSLKKNMTVATIRKKADTTKNKTFTPIVLKTEDDANNTAPQKAPRPGHKNNLSLNFNPNNKLERNLTSRNVSKNASTSRANTMHNSREKSTERSKPAFSKTHTAREKLNKSLPSSEHKADQPEKKLNNFQTHRNLKISHQKNKSESDKRQNIDNVTNLNTLANTNIGNTVATNNIFDNVSFLDSNSHGYDTSDRADKPPSKETLDLPSTKKQLESEFNSINIAVDGPCAKLSVSNLSVNRPPELDMSGHSPILPTLLDKKNSLNLKIPPLDVDSRKLSSTPILHEALGKSPISKKLSLPPNTNRNLGIDLEKEFPNYHFDLVFKENWPLFFKFFSKKEYLVMKNSCKLLSQMTNESLILFLQDESKFYEDKLNSLKEKITDEISKPIPDFSMGRSSSKAIELLDQDKYKNLFKNKQTPSEDIILPYRIYFSLMKKTELTSISDDSVFWNECCNYFNVDQVGNLITESVKSFDFSSENIYAIYRISYNKDKRLASSNFTKTCPTTGIMIFLIRETLEYIGIFIHQKYPPTANKLARLYQSILEGNEKRIDGIRQFKAFK